MKDCLYEGSLIHTKENMQKTRNFEALRQAMLDGDVLEGRAFVFDNEKNLIVPLCGIRGIIPFAECAIGMDSPDAKDIVAVSRVGKPVCFIIKEITTDELGMPVAYLSRRAVQERFVFEKVSRLVPGDVIPCCVTHIERFGCFADVGRGVIALLPIDLISVSRIAHPNERISVGDRLMCVVKSIDENGRIVLSQKELLGTFLENAALFSAGETVFGTVRSVEDYGVFVELTPNLSGLAEPYENVEAGDGASVYIKSIIPQKMKIKLSITDAFKTPPQKTPLRYFCESDHIDRFVYSPQDCQKIIETVF